MYVDACVYYILLYIYSTRTTNTHTHTHTYAHAHMHLRYIYAHTHTHTHTRCVLGKSVKHGMKAVDLSFDHTPRRPSERERVLRFGGIHTHTHTHTHSYLHSYTYICIHIVYAHKLCIF